MKIFSSLFCLSPTFTLPLQEADSSVVFSLSFFRRGCRRTPPSPSSPHSESFIGRKRRASSPPSRVRHSFSSPFSSFLGARGPLDPDLGSPLLPLPPGDPHDPPFFSLFSPLVFSPDRSVRHRMGFFYPFPAADMFGQCASPFLFLYTRCPFPPVQAPSLLPSREFF